MVYPQWWFDREKDDKPVDSFWDSIFRQTHLMNDMSKLFGKGLHGFRGHFASVFRQKTSLLFLGCWEQPWRSRVNGIWSIGYGSIPINTIFSGMNIHLPAILGFTRGTGFWPTSILLFPALIQTYPFYYFLWSKICVNPLLNQWFLNIQTAVN